MRIISGKFKGKKILEPLDKSTRPLKDLVKESIFNIIEHSKKFSINLNESNILDLFSGVGSFGLETLSRGANHVTFVENYQNVLSILKKNIHDFKVSKNCMIFEKNIFEHLEFDNLNKSYDIIFLDPPFKIKNIDKLLSKIFKSKVLNKKGIIILHRHSKEKNELPVEFRLLDEKVYGKSKIIFGNYL